MGWRCLLRVSLRFAFCSCGRQGCFCLWLFRGCLAPLFVREAFPDDDMMAQLFSMLDEAFVKDSFLDTIRWNLTTTRRFIVKAFCMHRSFPLGYLSYSLSDCGFAWNIIWKSPTPFIVSFFVWEAFQRKILTCIYFQKRGKILINRYFMCKDDL